MDVKTILRNFQEEVEKGNILTLREICWDSSFFVLVDKQGKPMGERVNPRNPRSWLTVICLKDKFSLYNPFTRRPGVITQESAALSPKVFLVRIGECNG